MNGSTTADWIISVAVFPKFVTLSFPWGAKLPDPHRLLNGSGNQNRYIRFEGPSTLTAPAVRALVRAAAAHTKTPLAATGRGRTIIKSVSVKQRARRAER